MLIIQARMTCQACGDALLYNTTSWLIEILLCFSHLNGRKLAQAGTFGLQLPSSS